MSSKTSKKTPPKATNTITTRNKSAQQNRQLRAKNKKTVKPTTKQTNTKTVTKSTKNTNDTCCKDTPLKTKVRNLVKLVEQVEYYPDLLKRDFSNKKIMLKPKPNFKVIASANKRKLTVPQKGGGLKPPPPLIRLRPDAKSMKSKCNSSIPEMSMVDMVRLIEDTHTLSDEDFMEILTCPSPVWWEDPPDDEYIEDAICTRSEAPAKTAENNTTTEQKTNKPKNKTKPKTKEQLIDFENEIEQFKITSTDTNKGEKFNMKKQKLENILGSIKNNKQNNEMPIENKVNNPSNYRKRKISNSTDGEFSDLSFNEEEVLKNLENMVIPIENDKNTEINKVTDQKSENNVIQNKLRTIKTELIEPEILPTLTREPDFVPHKIKSENSDSNSEFYLDSVSQSNFRFISDDDVSLDDSLGSNKIVLIDRSSMDETSPRTDTVGKIVYDMQKEQMNSNNTGNMENKNGFFRKKVMTDLSEYITVYKIVAQDEKNEKNNENLVLSPKNDTNKNGQLNSFFKKRKNNKRLKTQCDSPIPAPLANVKAVKENSDNQCDDNKNRLKSCDHSVVKNETSDLVCEKCEIPMLMCNSCNFYTDSKEVLGKHVDKCKYLTRVSLDLSTTEMGFGVNWTKA